MRITGWVKKAVQVPIDRGVRRNWSATCNNCSFFRKIELMDQVDAENASKMFHRSYRTFCKGTVKIEPF